MKKRLAAVTALAVQLDELIYELEASKPDQRPALLELANNFINHAYQLIEKGDLPSNLIAELVHVQRQLMMEVQKHKLG